MPGKHRFKFKLDFLLARGNRVKPFTASTPILKEKNDAELDLHAPDPNKMGVKFEALEGEEDGLCVIRGGPYATKTESLDAALRAKETVLIWATYEDICVDFDHFAFSDGTRAKDDTSPQLLADDEISTGAGIQILPEGSYTLGVLFKVYPNADRTPEQFAEEFRKFHSDKKRLSPKQIVALQLFNSTAFDTSEQSRFISTISAIEALIDSTVLEPVTVVEGLDQLSQLVKTLSTDDETKERLKQKLENAKELSIAKGGKQLVTELLGGRTYSGNSAAKTFEMLYGVRSTLVHDGHTRMRKEEFRELTKLSRTFVSDLILASIAKSSK